MKHNFSNIDLDEFAQLYYQLTNQQVANNYGVNRRTVQEWARKLGLQEKAPGFQGAPIAFPTNANEPYTQALSITSHRTAIIGDSHIPDHDTVIMDIVLKVAQKFGIYDLLVNGDFWSLDSFSAWAMAQVRSTVFRTEMSKGLIALQAFLQHFKRILMDEGNHERRMNHKTDGQMNVGEFVSELENVEFSDYDHIDLTSGDKEIYVVHQKNYGDKPNFIPEKLVVKFHKNIWCGHLHRLSFCYDPSGKYWLVEGGHLCSVEHIEYKMKRTTTHRQWTQGFGIVIDGHPYLIDKNNADFWLSLQPPQIEVEMKKVRGKRKAR